MKVEITHLKAPWPAGAVVGSVAEVPFDALPGCFAGKCKPAEEGAEAAFTYVPAPPPAVVAETKLAGPADNAEHAEMAEDLARAKALLAAAEQEADEMRQRAEAAEAKAAELGQQLQGLQEQLDAALVRVAQLEAEVAQAKAPQSGADQPADGAAPAASKPAKGGRAAA